MSKDLLALAFKAETKQKEKQRGELAVDIIYPIISKFIPSRVPNKQSSKKTSSSYFFYIELAILSSFSLFGCLLSLSPFPLAFPIALAKEHGSLFDFYSNN